MTSKYGEIIKFNILSCTLGYSGLHTFVYYETRSQEDLIRCLIETQQMIGRIPKRITTDNMSSIVKFVANKRYKHKMIVQFEKDIDVKIELCKVKTPQTKGKDESCNQFLNRLKPYNFNFEKKTELLTIISRINKRVNEQLNQTTGIPPFKAVSKRKGIPSPITY